MQAGASDGPIKIGFTSRLVQTRLYNLQVGCPFPLSLLASRQGTYADEIATHLLFQKYRMNGEWFFPSKKIFSFIKSLESPFFHWPVRHKDGGLNLYNVKIGPVMRYNLLVLARAFCAHTGVTLGVLSRTCHGDPPFFDRLVKGEGTISARKYDDITDWFDHNWPNDLVPPSIWTIYIDEPPPSQQGAPHGTAKEVRPKAGKARSR